MRQFGLASAFLLAFVLVSGAAAQGVPVSIAADLDPGSASGIRIEGLVADRNGWLYTADLDSRRFYRVTPETGAVEVLGTLPRTARAWPLTVAVISTWRAAMLFCACLPHS